MTSHLQPVTGRLSPVILPLDDAHVVELWWLDAKRVEMLVRLGDTDAFLLVFDQTANYDSPNYLWFRERYQGLPS